MNTGYGWFCCCCSVWFLTTEPTILWAKLCIRKVWRLGGAFRVPPPWECHMLPSVSLEVQMSKSVLHFVCWRSSLLEVLWCNLHQNPTTEKWKWGIFFIRGKIFLELTEFFKITLWGYLWNNGNGAVFSPGFERSQTLQWQKQQAFLRINLYRHDRDQIFGYQKISLKNCWIHRMTPPKKFWWAWDITCQGQEVNSDSTQQHYKTEIVTERISMSEEINPYVLF